MKEGPQPFDASASQFMFSRHDRVNEPLYVITPIFNPIRFRSRWKLYQDFAKRCDEAGAILYTIEAAYGNREFAITDPYNPRHIQVRTGHELWLKENLINVAVGRLPASAKYIAWVDADTNFVRDDWADETVHQLQHYDFVQMWSEFVDLDQDQHILGTWRSFMSCYLNGGSGPIGSEKHLYDCKAQKKGHPGAPGLAWAARRSALDAVGGLIDWTILGAGDWYMAHCLIGQLGQIIDQPGRHKGANFCAKLKEFEARCERHVRRNVGVVGGLAMHYWHGPKNKRGYVTRDKILINNQYDPELDIKRDASGVYQLSDQHTQRSIDLRDQIRAYFRQRNEDAN